MSHTLPTIFLSKVTDKDEFIVAKKINNRLENKVQKQLMTNNY